MLKHNMDIRKFFGGLKSTTGKQESGCTYANKKAYENKNNSRDQLSNSKNNNNNSKFTKLTKGGIDEKDDGEKIVIEDGSDSDDMIPSSPNSSSVTLSRNTKGEYFSRKTSRGSEKHSASKSHEDDRSGEKSKTEKEIKQDKVILSYRSEKKSERLKDKDTKMDESRSKDKSKLKKEHSFRRSPRKQSSVIENDGQKNNSKGRKCPNKMIIDESDEEAVIKDTLSEDEEVVTTIRRRSGGSGKRGLKAAKVLDSDSDEDPMPKKTPQSKKKKKAAVSFVQDSDEEKVETPMDKFLKRNSTSTGNGDVNAGKVLALKKQSPTKVKNVNVSDFFGTSTVSSSRVERSVPEKRKLEEIEVKCDPKPLTEIDIHDDDEDFLAVLNQLDGPDTKKIKMSESKEKTPENRTEFGISGSNSKERTNDSKGSLASKLANKRKEVPKEDEKNEVAKKKSPSSSKASKPVSSTKTCKSYIMEVIKPDQKKPVKDKEESKQDIKTPQKPAMAFKPASSSKKEMEDDGFGTKRTSGFRAFKMREGPQDLGSKEIPTGEDNCLEGMNFVITGILDSIERDDAKSLVERYGGKVTTSLSKKTTYLVVGREPGESKLTKAVSLKVNQLNEDGLFDLIRNQPGKTSKYVLQAKETLKKEESLKLEKLSSVKKLDSFKRTSPISEKPAFTKLKSSEEKPLVKNEGSSQDEKEKEESNSEVELWVDKYKPTTMKQIIGQQGDKSNGHKLLYWIKHWHNNIIVKGMKASGNFFGKGGGDGSGFRAALLSGPPGIGKTTTATLVCKEAGFSYVELNASDTRSKKSLKEVVSEAVNNHSLVDYLGDSDKKTSGQGHCLIMDEVDGMAGNEDRGGLQELVQLIKSSKIPILCICNERNSPKMRTLSNYCFDLRFQRPRIEQIKGAMMTLAFREGLKIPAPAVQEIIQAANHDIRQVIHNLSMWTVGEKNLTFDQVKADSRKAQKDLKLGPFDVCRKVFVSDDETRKMSIFDKSDLYFHDYSFAPLFVHENYPHVIPAKAQGNKGKHMAFLAHTMDSLCDGDLVERLIRKEGNWNLLPVQAMYSSVLPGEYMRGSFPQMTAFPLWLGKNSSTGKTDRQLQELAMHMSLNISCDKRSLNLDYLPTLRTCLTAPLASLGQDGVPGVLNVMQEYDLVKDDFDSIMEVAKWPNSIDFMAKVEPKTKAALTRMYNKSNHMMPYSTGACGKKKKGGNPTGEEDLLREEGEDTRVESEEDDVSAMLKKPKGKTAKGGKQESTTGFKGKGKK